MPALSNERSGGWYRLSNYPTSARRRPASGPVYSPRLGRYISGKPRSRNPGMSYSQRRHGRVRTTLFNRNSDRVPMKIQTIEEVQTGPQYVITNNTSKVSYITYPSISRSAFCSRVNDYIKVLSVSASGSVVVKQVGSTPGASSTCINGIFTTVLVRDMRPSEFSSSDPIVPYGELFGLEQGSCSNLRVRDNHADRFRVLWQKKSIVNTSLSTYVFKFDYRVLMRHYPFWVRFKDIPSLEASGRYGNISKNALVLYYVWLCDSPVTAEVHVKYDTKYLG
ncbi:BV1 protein [Clerodendrum golden mosaic China virus]|uniref:Nuclear shuttle protein n=1 Tax=Clerodendrum golden mosaic China virus TaxID=559878 RepID=B6DP82_9GEMI|nr:BV1 protein [Clerodendrum golden mosaic China virus]ACI24166.1 BV1 protein [Clerodendrum golden mosaic China virus]ACI24170.1 BV1 protein [Clerodendrum golden mosaic China virus]ACI24174.1 BV1 protein [Clerodendrum golden mosaic China virus]